MSICNLFQEISSNIWDIITSNHSNDNRLHEEGITREHVIGSILGFVKSTNSSQILAQKAKNEVKSGADIEIYLQVLPKQFIRILIQAKIVELDGTFKLLNKESGTTGKRQYDTLLDYARISGAKSYYLFYNGIPGFQCQEKDCYGNHDEKQYGCALKTAEEVKQYCDPHSNPTLGNSVTPEPQGNPWRFLTCCAIAPEGNERLFTPESMDDDRNFERLFTEETLSFITPRDLNNLNETERINNELHQKGWNPSYRFFILKRPGSFWERHNRTFKLSRKFERIQRNNIRFRKHKRFNNS